MHAADFAQLVNVAPWVAVLCTLVACITYLTTKPRSLATKHCAISRPLAGAQAGSESDSNLSLGSDDEDHDMKLTLVIRKDLGMTKGKVAAQCCHATLGCYKRAQRHHPRALKVWEWSGQAKVTLRCDDEAEMLALQQAAAAQGLTTYCVQDAGRTQIAAGSRTVLGIGPGPVNAIDQVTGHLKLY
ncbi:hypothetical protein H4R34_001496 [Dimargaris verticillata]|uniref:peptidyl-tRNA hydrolase n=1 Tax=Dimargaris verticillata TaxID=2761393 RepID=A0A9W8EEX9_9FUNG|nr:hypothetical protein H4R34_001496 [Dimargaris verticillata]